MIEDIIAPDRFLVRWEIKEAYVEFTVWEIASVALGERFFVRAGAKGSWEHVTDPAAAEVYVQGIIKWDGCSNVDFPDPLHLCGRRCWQSHVDVMKHLWRRAGELLGQGFPGEDFKPLDPPADAGKE